MVLQSTPCFEVEGLILRRKCQRSAPKGGDANIEEELPQIYATSSISCPLESFGFVTLMVLTLGAQYLVFTCWKVWMYCPPHPCNVAEKLLTSCDVAVPDTACVHPHVSVIKHLRKTWHTPQPMRYWRVQPAKRFELQPIHIFGSPVLAIHDVSSFIDIFDSHQTQRLGIGRGCLRHRTTRGHGSGYWDASWRVSMTLSSGPSRVSSKNHLSLNSDSY
jgi:hypothetical protein